MKTILLKFAGPLQSWGTDSHFETRKTDLHPSKSAVIGLISASYGYRRDEDEKIQKLNELNFVTRIDQQGSLLRDYHIAQKYKASGDFDRTYVTNRYYLEDAIFIVGLSHENDDFIDEIYESLQNPYFQTFLGKRSCPPTADFLIGVFNQDIITAISDYPWQASPWYRKNHSNKLSSYADSNLVENLTVLPRRDKVLSFSQKSRIHQYRNESHMIIEVKIPKDKLNEEMNIIQHDVFASIKEF